MDVVEQIRAILDRATQDFDGRDEVMRRAADEIDRLRTAPTVAAQQCGQTADIGELVKRLRQELEGMTEANDRHAAAWRDAERRCAELEKENERLSSKVVRQSADLEHAIERKCVAEAMAAATLRDRIEREPVVTDAMVKCGVIAAMRHDGQALKHQVRAILEAALATGVSLATIRARAALEALETAGYRILAPGELDDASLEAAAKVAESRHEVWNDGDGFTDGEGLPAVSCDVTACENIASAIRALKDRSAG